MNVTSPSRLAHQTFKTRLLSLTVLGNGVLITFNSLATHLIVRRRIWDSRLQINVGIVVGLTLIYLSSLLRRRWHTAWLLTMCIYAFVLSANITAALLEPPHGVYEWLGIVRSLLLPSFVVMILLANRHTFTVKSDTQNFTLALRRVALVLVVALLYGVIGFELLERRDFHQELNLWQSLAYTVDQFGIFTKEPLSAFSYRGKVFLDSLSLISGLSVAYVFLALFQPIRARFSDQTEARDKTRKLLEAYGGNSEDFFKLWPLDKSYVFSSDNQAVVAFQVTRGVALAVGSPVGRASSQLLAFRRFLDLCRSNDWLPAFVHTEVSHAALYRHHDFSVQKIGEEAIVDIERFMHHQIKDKYFRHINNRFAKQGYQTELLSPPHNTAILQRLQVVSDEWLRRPGRSERGLLMGYFSEDYLNQVPVMVLRDAAGTIQAFINEVQSFDPDEGNYDMLRYSEHAPGNCNDYLLVQFMQYLQHAGKKRLNLGLCPLAGVGDEDEDEPGVVDTVVRFVYTNGERIYSFSGLHRFKAKYDPEWRDRYIAYRGGLRGLSRTVRALTRAMKR